MTFPLLVEDQSLLGGFLYCYNFVTIFYLFGSSVQFLLSLVANSLKPIYAKFQNSPCTNSETEVKVHKSLFEFLELYLYYQKDNPI